MKYEITQEVFQAIRQELIRVNVPVQTLIYVEQTITKTPIVEEPKIEEAPKTK